MRFQFAHTNINVLDLERSLAFYREALGLEEVRRVHAPDGSFILAFITDHERRYQMELTWLRERKTPYDLSDNETHVAFTTPDLKAAKKKHAAMGCIAHENEAAGLYFIEDPDGYWMEILPE